MEMPLLSSVSQTGPSSGRANSLNWKGGADPKGDPRHDDFLAVLFALNDQLRPVHEERTGHQSKVACHHRAGNCAEQPGDLGHEGHDDEEAADEVADTA